MQTFFFHPLCAYTPPRGLFRATHDPVQLRSFALSHAKTHSSQRIAMVGICRLNLGRTLFGAKYTFLSETNSLLYVIKTLHFMRTILKEQCKMISRKRPWSWKQQIMKQCYRIVQNHSHFRRLSYFKSCVWPTQDLLWIRHLCYELEGQTQMEIS